MWQINRNTYFILFCLSLLFSQCALFKTADELREEEVSRTGDDRLRSDIVNYAEQFVGTEYKFGGTSPRTGFDCSGFTSYVMRNFDIEIPRSSKLQEKDGEKLRVGDVRPGDLIFYRRSPLGSVFHVSLVVSNDKDGITVIHSVSRGVVVENITKSSYWEPKISSARDVVSR